jgi:hypothetical protein
MKLPCHLSFSYTNAGMPSGYINLGSSAFLLSDVQHSFLPSALVTTGLELTLTTVQVASAYVATTTFLIFL